MTRLPAWSSVVIVNDGAERWVVNRREVYAWLRRHGHDRGVDRNTRLSNSVTLDADAYQDLCDSVSYRGRYDHLTHGDIRTLEQRGTDTLHVL